MPLIKSGTREALKENIKELIKSGRTRNQAVAIAKKNQKEFITK